MYFLLKVFGRTKPNARLAFIENVIQRECRVRMSRKITKKSKQIEVIVVGSGSFGDPAALAVKTCNNFLYLLNCGEGTFRLMYKAPWLRYVTNIFRTSNRWERVGGIPSLARAVFDRKSGFPTFHGPPQLEQCLAKFAELTDLDPELITEHQFDQESCFVENHIQVDSVKLNRTNASNSNETVIAYVCRLMPRSGKVDLGKIAANNLPIEHANAINKGTHWISRRKFFRYCGLKHIHSRQHSLNELDAEIFPHLSSKFQPSTQTFTSLDSLDQDKSDTICIEPTTSGIRYIFPLTDEISDKELAGAADDEDDEQTDSSGEDCVTNEETEVYTMSTRVNAFLKIVFFGTGSAFPGVTKSVPSILVRTSPVSSILLDCGEGSVGQMCRFYGSRMEDVICSIMALHITHMHGDHHAGVMDLIRIRQKYIPEHRPKLLLMAPKQAFESFSNFYQEHFRNVCDEITMIDNEDLLNGMPDELKSGINDLRTCRVPHMDKSYAISLNLIALPEQKDFKLTFSGDTAPCDALVKLGKNSTLLIHEATFEDTLAHRATLTQHSTISQAIEQSERMQAEYTLLTHFSQRYRVLPPINDDLMKDKNIGVAFDFMEVVPDDLPKLNDLYFKLKETYSEELSLVEKKSEKRALINERRI